MPSLSVNRLQCSEIPNKYPLEEIAPSPGLRAGGWVKVLSDFVPKTGLEHIFPGF